jgi:hypothetical protein
MATDGLDKKPYYEKKSHMLGHRGEHWPTEDRLRVKHLHAKMVNKRREQEEVKTGDYAGTIRFETNKRVEPHPHGYDHRHNKPHNRHKEKKHLGKILPSDPELDRQWKEEHLQHLGDLQEVRQHLLRYFKNN